MRFLNEFGATGFHAIVIWAIFVPFWITTLYYTALPILREIARVRLAAVAKLAADKQAVQDEKPPVPCTRSRSSSSRSARCALRLPCSTSSRDG